MGIQNGSGNLIAKRRNLKLGTFDNHHHPTSPPNYFAIIQRIPSEVCSYRVGGVEIEFGNGESNVSLFYHCVLTIISLLFLRVHILLNDDLFFIIMPHHDHLWICVPLALIYSLTLRQHDIVDFFEHHNLLTLTHNKQSAKDHRNEREIISPTQ